MTIKPYNVCNAFIYKILFDLLESSKIASFEDLFNQIIEVKVTENYFFLFFMTLTSIIRLNGSLNEAILDNSDRSNKILDINLLQNLYDF